MSYMESQIQTMYDNQENHYQSQQEIISDLSQDNHDLTMALRDVLGKVQDTHPELILKYGAMVNGNSTSGN